MRTLILTSAGMRMAEEIVALLPRPPKKMHVVHVMTAAKGEADASYATRDSEFMRALGFTVVDVDIENKHADELRRIFSKSDVIYVQGGNTFYLMKAIRESGFDKVVRELLDAGKIYIGVSAGTIVAGTDVGVARQADPNHVGLTDFSGMGLVDLIINPHHDHGGEEAAVRAYERETGRSVLRLTDDQLLLVQGDRHRVLQRGVPS